MKLSIGLNSLTELQEWFINYVQTFYNRKTEIQQNIVLKKEHTHRVCKEIVAIGQELKLNNDELQLSEIIALLHDVGRFEQYARYRTFMDSKSENHAELGVKIIERESILKPFNPEVQKIILQSIKYHNWPLLPCNVTEPVLLYAKLIRDADKLDIWKVVTDYYNKKDKRKNSAIELDLPDSPEISDTIVNDLIKKRIVNFKDVKNLNDFKLLQIGWVFDINFQPTLNRIKERGYLEMIRDVLPESKKINKVFDIISYYSKI